MIYNKYLNVALDYDKQLDYFEEGIEAFHTLGYVHPLKTQNNDFWLKNGSKLLKEPKIMHFYDPEKEKALIEEE